MGLTSTAAAAAAAASKNKGSRKMLTGASGVLPRTGLGMALNLLLLLAMVATNLLSLYHLTTTTTTLLPSLSSNPIPPTVPSHLLSQLSTIRSSISHLTSLQTTSASSSKLQKPPSDLLLLSKTSPIATSCLRHPDLLRRYMNYTPFLPCPALQPPDLADLLLLLGCYPLPRRRCFSSSSPPHLSTPLPLPEPSTFRPSSNLDLTVPHLLRLARDASALPIRLALDVAGGTAPFAAEMRDAANATVLTTTLDLGGARNGAAVARRGVVPLHAPLQQRFPVQDAALDLVRFGRAVNRWVPTETLGFLLFDVDRVLRTGGMLWIDHFFSKRSDLDNVYGPLIRKLGYRIFKWTTANKTDGGGAKSGDVYLTALLQKHPNK